MQIAVAGIQMDTSEVDGELIRIADAFELGQIANDDMAALLVRVIREGTYVHDCAEPYCFRLRWKEWAREAIQRVLG